MPVRRIPVSKVIGVLLLATVLFTPRALAAGLSILPGVGSYLAAGLDYFSSVTVYNAPEQPQPAALALAEEPGAAAQTVAPSSDAGLTGPVRTRVVYEYLPATSTPALAVSTSGVTEPELDQKLAALKASLEGEIKNVSGTPALTSSGILQGFAVTNAAVGDSSLGIVSEERYARCNHLT